MKVKIILTSLLAILMLTACSSQKPNQLGEAMNKKVNEEKVGEIDISKIDIANYFPYIGLERHYREFNQKGEVKTFVEQVKQNYDMNGKAFQTIEGHHGGGEKTFHEYNVTNEEIRMVYLHSTSIKQAFNTVELSKRKEWQTGDDDNSTSYVTGVGLTMKVQAGEFKDVLEVTNVVSTNSKKYKTKNYYAPKVGVIKTIRVTSDNEELTILELESTNLESLLDPSKDNQPLPEGFRLYEDKKYGFSFMLPTVGSENVKVTSDTWKSDEVVQFMYKTGELNQFMFSIVVRDEFIEEKKWDNPMETYLGTNGKQTFSLSLAEELELELMLPENKKHEEIVQEILEEKETIVSTFKLN